ncbi:MAG: polysaccharide transporter [Leptolyngbyaceae cyanobacterium RM2_2_4]|nr:polysaccharide transporter [Leptolyngbyaceae cyanobacterium SM1_4_3]NJN56541.1 polysaccharide transporter [Leptolyngbyaceae cyanobacterium SL_5_9]NJO48406.1 polysaccharide transporter [Leptolyngbyaceae cyanobacterium RM2_2_4]
MVRSLERTTQFVSIALSSLIVLSHTSLAIAQIPLNDGITPNPTPPAAPPLEPSVPDQSIPADPARSQFQDYTLGAGDRVRLDLFEVPEYSGEYQVLSDGTLSLPRIGIVPVRGLTIDQASAEISNRYATYVRRPFVTITLLEAGAINIAIAGQVQRPGTYVVSEAEIAGIPTVTQVIKLAGGITQDANVQEVLVRRPAPRLGGASQEIQVNLWELLRTGDISQDLVVRDGDTIVIPTATALSPAEATEIASASFSPDTITVNVVGEVAQPGAIAVPPNTPLNQAILAAGGFNTRASEGEVELVRLNPNGTVSREVIEIDLAQAADPEANPPLRSNDTVIVERSSAASFSDTAGFILSPVLGIVRILEAIF